MDEDNIVMKLVDTLDSTELVHLLLEMVPSKTIVQNILLTKKEQDRLSHTTGRTHREMVCFECTGIHNKLLVILEDYNLHHLSCIGVDWTHNI